MLLFTLRAAFLIAAAGRSFAAPSDVYDCPDPFNVYPCYCEDETDDGEVFSTLHCNNLNETKQVRRALGTIDGHKIKVLSMYKTDIKPVPSDMFKGPHIDQMLFTSSPVQMDSPQFVGLESSLTRLEFMVCFDDSNPIKSFSFSHLENLKEVTFDRNVIKTLKNDWLSSSGPSLRSISFTQSRIQKLEDRVFANVKTLKTLYLNDNEITSVTRSMFPRVAESLRSINLNNNKLKDFPDDIFERMPSLNSLELQNNLFKTLDEKTWSAMFERLSRLYIDENPIRCDRDLKWISKTRLPNIFHGKCETPSKLKNKDLKILTPADFH